MIQIDNMNTLHSCHTDIFLLVPRALLEPQKSMLISVSGCGIHNRVITCLKQILGNDISNLFDIHFRYTDMNMLR